jgi:hypothetical protein
MPFRSVICLSAAFLLALGNAWCGPEPVSAANQGAIKAEAQKTESAGGATANRIGSPTTTPALSDHAEHAPLAFFSLGSLAVGGAFYAIHLSTSRSNSEFSAADRTSLTNAIGAAGITALLAAGSYFWFTRDGAHEAYSGKAPERDWDARVSGGVDPDGEMSVGAMVTLPLSFLAP